jgi:PTS system nitrogen regulatory IIA component
MHLRILAHISRLLKDEEFRRGFVEADNRDEILDMLKSA